MDSTTEATSEKIEKSYLSVAVDSISPWNNSRFSAPKSSIHGDTSGLKNQYGGNRITQQSYGPSLRRYPPDCPPLCPRWFHAIDVPKRKPKLLNTKSQSEPKAAPAPKKFAAFSEHDSKSIEVVYQQLVEEYYDSKRGSSNLKKSSLPPATGREKSNTSLNDAASEENLSEKFRIPVHEDFLFDVDVEKREVSPVYWLGPIYEVRRGSWFYQEGTSLRPCEENLAIQLEEGYLKTKPFRYQKTSEISSNLTKSSLKSGDIASSSTPMVSTRNRPNSSETALNLPEDLKSDQNDVDENPITPPKESSINTNNQLQTYRLFGTYMNTVVTYQDSNIAWLSADSIMSRVSSTVYQKFAGGGHLGGVKLVRGYTEPNKTKESPENKTSLVSSTTTLKSPNDYLLQHHDRAQQKILKSRHASSESLEIGNGINQDQMQSNNILLMGNKNNGENDAEASKIQEPSDNRSEYNDLESESQGRQIDHLILCTHGIGQRLGMRTETVNFVQDINVLRKTLKSVYESSSDLQALNSEIDKFPKNCRIQVLPICWRHLLDFPQKGVRQTRKEHDLGDAFGDEEEYPSLEDITIDSVPFVRSLITDLALDILLFQSAYREHICNIVLAESNRIYNLFRERNPDFRGKVSLLGHSLGSAILFDLLSRQKEQPNDQGSRPKNYNKQPSFSKSQQKDLEFEFEVEDFYCYGSPIGLFQMLKGRNILARRPQKDIPPCESVIDSENFQDSFFSTSSSSKLPSNQKKSSDTGLPPTVSSPKVRRLYNIFHPSDPIAYRLEPLISPAMSSVKPQSLPFTKRTISSSMSGIGAKVGQSVSGILTSLSSGLASSIFNRSLGLTNGDIARMEASGSSKQSAQAISASKISGATLDASALKKEESSSNKRRPAEISTALDQEGIGPVSSATFLDENIETLYSRFQKSYRVDQGTAEEKLRRIKREEAKVRALNSNGRVDYSIQETFLDYNPMNTIASHMSYWADEDVSHFMMSQLLSGHRQTVKYDKITTDEK
ncbi:putative phospholipase C20G8.02, mitochondrial [Erysiphe neolycopersici]|uniref:Putative phospholipase C20G8.02, mitochondrial n=1 Tax=Erysiphe neolycopersici TaxID=212602 RepID=A0A420HU57_9PEZI|nr:putative phospholipase C20G8.02, mitochondrial [Erysiphe neolycopersici]